MVRGHDHVEERRAYGAHPLITAVALSRRLPREQFGPDERVPTVVCCMPGYLPKVHRRHVPPELVHAVFGSPRESALHAGDPAHPEAPMP